MRKLKRKKLRRLSTSIDDAVEQVVSAKPSPPITRKPKLTRLVSTGSTLLDLAISGKATKRGGVPGGIIVEVYGPSGAGKTAVLVSLTASAQAKGGASKFLDPEARLNQEYSKIYGMTLKQKDYHRPDQVTEMFDHIYGWEPKVKKQKAISIIAADSLAALTTDWEMDGQDQYGMRRAKQFSEGLRKTARIIANNNWIIACSNQERQGPSGTTTPGGKGIPYYASLRIRIAKMFPKGKLFKEKTIGRKKVKRVEGVISNCQVTKSSIDEPFREAPIYIVFGYGIDDIRGNLQYVKDMTGNTKYDCISKNYAKMDLAINWVEEHDHEEELRNRTIELWNEVQKKFKTTRKRKTLL